MTLLTDGNWAEASDAELIRHCLDGQAAAWETLLARYERLIYSTALRAGTTPDESADVFQAVCLIWLEQLGRLRDPQRLGGWLVTTTRRECWARWRKGRAIEEDPETPLAEMQSPDESPEMLAARNEDARAVRRALRHLPDNCRRLLSLLYYDSAKPSYEEVGRQLKMAVNSVGPTRARCLEKLKELLKQAGW